MNAWCGEGRVRFVVVFDGPNDLSSIEVARSRLQWFVQTFVGVGSLRDWDSGEGLEELMPVRTAFCVDHMPNEVFWCGDEGGLVDEALASKAADLASSLGWPRWDLASDVVVVDVYSAVTDG